MARVHSLPRRSADIRWGERTRLTALVALEPRRDMPAAHDDPSALRARVRMELLVARARAERPR
jgi:hypothetical protein